MPTLNDIRDWQVEYRKDFGRKPRYMVVHPSMLGRFAHLVMEFIPKPSGNVLGFVKDVRKIKVLPGAIIFDMVVGITDQVAPGVVCFYDLRLEGVDYGKGKPGTGLQRFG